AGRDFYVHISKVSGGVRPRIGDQVSFDTPIGRKGRPSAAAVTLAAPAVTQPTLRAVRQANGPDSRYTPALRTGAPTPMTPPLPGATGTERAPVWLGLLYGAMGTGSAVFYRSDKLYALTGKSRVSEANLHLVDFCFGIIGGLAAQ